MRNLNQGEKWLEFANCPALDTSQRAGFLSACWEWTGDKRLVVKWWLRDSARSVGRSHFLTAKWIIIYLARSCLPAVLNGRQWTVRKGGGGSRPRSPRRASAAVKIARSRIGYERNRIFLFVSDRESGAQCSNYWLMTLNWSADDGANSLYTACRPATVAVHVQPTTIAVARGGGEAEGPRPQRMR